MMNNINLPPQLVQMLKGGGNPQDFVMNFLKGNSNGNPMFENIINLANKGDGTAVEQICRNVLKSKGYDPDELMRNFQNQLK